MYAIRINLAVCHFNLYGLYIWKQYIMHASNWKRKSLKLLKTIKTTLSTLSDINLPWVLDEEINN